MKPVSPHDPLDEMIAAALHGDLSPDERAQFESRLQTDPAAQAAYQEAQAMHDLLEKTHANAQPDPAFEQRMVSGVRRKLQDEQHGETLAGSLLFFWKWVRGRLTAKWSIWEYSAVSSVALVVLAFSFALYHDARLARTLELEGSGIADPGVPVTVADFYLPPDLFLPVKKEKMVVSTGKVAERFHDTGEAKRDVTAVTRLDDVNAKLRGANTYTGGTAVAGGAVDASGSSGGNVTYLERYADPSAASPPQGGTMRGAGSGSAGQELPDSSDVGANPDATLATVAMPAYQNTPQVPPAQDYEAQVAAPAPSVVTTPRTVVAANNDTIARNGVGPNSPDVSFTSPPASIAMPPPPPGFDPGTHSGAMVVVHKSADELETIENAQQAQERVPVIADLKRSPDEEVLADKKLAARSMIGANTTAPVTTPSSANKGTALDANGTPAPAAPPAIDTRKLIRNAQLDLEVKSFQAAMDQITALTKAAGGYVDTSNSQKGGNGKLQGTVVVKVLPQNLDDFLLKLRDLGQAQNQSVSTDDVTKDYYDTQARLDNSRRMEEQLQDLLKHANSKVADLLQVERELGRVRGDIEQMQGQLKLYDFQVQYATVTIQMREKDMNQTAAYLLKEQDDFSLFATDVEGTFQKARAAADDFKAQVLVANLVHNSGSDVAAELTVMVAPDQIEPFLAQVRSLGRVANFTRQTQRVAKDGGDSDVPADQTLTEKDKVQVHLSIRSDDETRKQVALTVVAKAVDDALDQAKTAALANAGVEILSSSLNKTPQGQSTAQLTLRVPGQEYAALIASFKALGRTASLSIQRNDNSGPGANGDDAPVIVSLALTDDDTPLQETAMSVMASDVDTEAQQIKKDAATAGVEVKASSFERQPDGTELAQMTFRLPMAKYAAFMESVKALGKVESLSVHRDDRPDQTVSDDTAPVEISLQLHNQRNIVADNSGLWATLRQTFGDGAGALFGSVRVIGVVIAFLIPWVVTLVFLAWVGRRIYIWRKK